MMRAPVWLTLAAAGAACSGGGSPAGRGLVAARDGAVAGAARDAGDALAPVDGVGDDDDPEPHEVATGDEGDADEPGTLRVKVVWPRPAAPLLRSPGQNSCGGALRPPLEVDPAGAIADRYATERVVAVSGAVVVLEGVAAPAGAGAAGGSTIAVRDCALWPRVVAAARGAELTLVNADPQRHELAIAAVGAAAPLAVAPLPVIGHAVAVRVETPGVLSVASRADPDAPAYAVVVDGEYAAVTDAVGEAVFRGLAPGIYALRVWYPPVATDGPPITARASVEIAAGAAARIVARLGT
jgi:hypothetical protein